MIWPSVGNFVPGPIDPGDEAWLSGTGVGVGDAPRDARRGERQLVGAVGDAVLGEHDRERAEGVGLDDVDPDVEERAVQRVDDVGLGDDQDLVATLEGGAAEVVGAQMLELEVGAGGAVEDEDALGPVRSGTGRQRPGRANGGRDVDSIGSPGYLDHPFSLR